MKIIFQDFKKGTLKIELSSLDDLWFLSHIIEENDSVSGRTFRKIKIGEGTDRNLKIIKKAVTLKINVEKIEFHKYSNSLRVSGKITEGPEDIPKGSYHTFDLEEGTTITITKSEWLKYQIEKIQEASSERTERILIIALDREEATFALLTQSGYKILTNLEGECDKKGYEEVKGKHFYVDVAKQTKDYFERFNIEHIILASPAFWKEDLLNIIKKKNSTLVSKITFATCNSTGQTGIEEILKRDEVKTVLKQDRTTKETSLVEELFKEISKQTNSAYGFEEIKEANAANAIKLLLVTDDYIRQLREESKYFELDQIMKDVDRTNGEVHIISTDHDAGKKLQGLGGIGATLRFRLK